MANDKGETYFWSGPKSITSYLFLEDTQLKINDFKRHFTL